MGRALSPVLGTVLTLFASAAAHAQTDELRLRATRRDTITARATVTATFAVSNQRDQTVQVMPHVETPKDWTILTGGTPFSVPPRSTDLLMLSVAVPARAAAGVYPIRVRVTTPVTPSGVLDSALVVVLRRRALEVGLIERPGFVVSGKSYEAGFLVRNRGNVATAVRLTASSTLGSATLVEAVVQLEAEESRVVRAKVRTRGGLESATDDVLEIAATQADDPGARADASARVTVIPEPSRKIEEYLKVPTEVRLRAANTDGVSPFEVFGRGAVRDRGETQIDFLFRGPTGKYSAFGERDEYRLELSAPWWRARVGDQFFMLSPLTGGAQPGFGAGTDVTRGMVSVGAYGQQFRRSPLKGSESGAAVSLRPLPDARLALNVVNRLGGSLPGRIGSASASLDRQAYRAEFELARGQGTSGPGLARAARLSGGTSALSYDIAHLYADTAFSGSQRGSEHDYLTASSHNWDVVWFALNGGTHRTDLSRSTGVPYLERLDVGTFSATLLGRLTTEVGSVERTTTIQGVAQKGQQRGVRMRGDQDLVFGTVSLEAEAGRVQEGGRARAYTDWQFGARRALAHGALAVWADRYSGGSITRGADGALTLGSDASFRVSRATDFMLTGYVTRAWIPGAEWHSQLDAQVAYRLPTGNTVTLRARLVGGGSLSSADQSVAYLEYGVPLRLPVSRLRTPGRVYGRVVDAVTGSGIPNALVRLGPQVAITDKQGQVAFGGVPGGEHRVSMSQETSFSDAVFVGDPTVIVDSMRSRPTTFMLAIARSARLDIAVRRYTSARTGIAGGADSLVDAGPLADAALVLASERDTLYRTTSEGGKVSFTDVPPGTWRIMIRGDAPAFYRFDPDRLELTLAPGEAKELTFRLVPRRREVQLIGDGQELRPTLDPKAKPAAPAAPRTVKPEERKNKP